MATQHLKDYALSLWLKANDLKKHSANKQQMEAKQIAHLAGVFDVSGTITVSVAKNDSYRIGYSYKPMITLKRRQQEFNPVIGKAMAYAEDEGVRYHMKEESSDENVVFNVTEPESIRRFLEPMMPYFVNRFEAAKLMIEVVVPSVKDDKHLEKESFVEMVEVADVIRDANKTDSKYTADYFEEEWSMRGVCE